MTRIQSDWELMDMRHDSQKGEESYGVSRVQAEKALDEALLCFEC
jgi:hypothetical protein